MVNIWDFENYRGKVRVVTKDGMELVGIVSDVEDMDEDEAYPDDCINLYCQGEIWGVFQYQIEKIEPLG